ncbi:hypothetical protein [Sutcliffiella horikoshii]|uniref:hypothetical protein n=1 Tax=Sutcliffiella horikoshii TaxID=79883 RepID=UPI001F397B2D|nr:hypothetical protein [Sutcliffiella horikoshii]MCG1020785.1 hypothetical protein [Sutcliffiella horikoshii]
MKKLYCEYLEHNFNHGNRIPVKNIAKGIANWMKKHESDYKGKWENLDFATDMNKNLYWFLNEIGLRVSNIRGFVKDRKMKEELFCELESLNIQVKEKQGKLNLYDLDHYGKELEESEKAVIQKFIYYVKREKSLKIDSLQPVIYFSNSKGNLSEVKFNISKAELSEILQKYEEDIKKTNIAIKEGEYPEIKIYSTIV